MASAFSTSATTTSVPRTEFERQRGELVQEIAESFEQVLANINKLNRNLEAVITVGNEFSSVEALWSTFENVMGNNNHHHHNNNSKDNKDNNDNGNGKAKEAAAAAAVPREEGEHEGEAGGEHDGVGQGNENDEDEEEEEEL